MYIFFVLFFIILTNLGATYLAVYPPLEKPTQRDIINPKYVTDMFHKSPIYVLDMFQINPRYVPDKSRICPRYVQDMFKMCPRYVPEYLIVCPSLEKHWITLTSIIPECCN